MLRPKRTKQFYDSISNKYFDFVELSMGMSSDYVKAAKNFSTYVRIGSGIFGQRF